MKKLKLKLDGVKEMLTRQEMKKVSGGYMGNFCLYYCCDLFNQCEDQPRQVYEEGCTGDAYCAAHVPAMFNPCFPAGESMYIKSVCSAKE